MSSTRHEHIGRARPILQLTGAIKRREHLQLLLSRRQPAVRCTMPTRTEPMGSRTEYATQVAKPEVR